MHLAASYQIWAAMMVPLMIPIVVAAAAKMYNQDIWIPPLVLLKQIATKQLLPLALGMVTIWIAPKVGQRCQVALNLLGNFLLTIMIGLVLLRMGPALKAITLMLPFATLLLAVGSICAVRLIGLSDPLVKQTFAVCNANRHVGLALLLSGKYLHSTRALPAIACYALIAPVVMFAYARWYRAKE
jgi:bile acid:Na+ symporter, BASS family